jgi:single-strand DNA-binding protein
MNQVSLIGRFAKDPELRYIASGTAICNFTLAVRNPFDKDGNADFIQCVAWGNGAELVAEKHVKGNMIGVDGRISTRNYENNEGQRVYVTEVNVNSIHLIQTKDYAENQQNYQNGNNDNGNGNGGNKGNNGNRNGNGNRNNGNRGNGNRNNN